MRRWAALVAVATGIGVAAALALYLDEKRHEARRRDRRAALRTARQGGPQEYAVLRVPFVGKHPGEVATT